MVMTVVLLLAALMAATVLFRPSLTSTPGGRVLGLLSLMVVPMLALGMGLSEHVERSKTTAFCLGCHVMDDYGHSLHVDDITHLPASHYLNGRVPKDNACFTCHTTYTMYGDWKAKLRGLRHVWVQYAGTVPDPIRLYEPYHNRECLHCHLGSRSFEEGKTHSEEPERMAEIKSNKLSCLKSGCHDTIHDVKQLDKMTFWPPPPATPASPGDKPGDKPAAANQEKAR